MLLGAAAFAAMTVIVRIAADTLHPLEIVFFRNLFGLAAMVPWFARAGLGGLKTERLGLYSLRTVFGLIAMTLWFWGVTVLPLGDAVALSFTAPLFGALAAVIVLGEMMGIRRAAALVFGFIGALIIIRPGFSGIGAEALLVVCSSLFVAASLTTVKVLSRSENTIAIVTWMVLLLTPLSLIPALFVWRWPDGETFLWLALMGGLATIGQLALTRAYAVTEVTVVLPFDYARLPFAAAIAYFVFAEVPEPWTWAGAAVIALATVYIAQREARLARAGQRVGTVTVAAGGAETAIPPETGNRGP
jgi:drug/metabolite transporter (DMT)-like permease